MRASHNLARVSATFDHDGLVPHGGLVVAGALTQKFGAAELVDGHVTATRAGAVNASAKALPVIGSALAGGDCIDDVAALSAGATRRLFDGIGRGRRWARGCGRSPGRRSASSTPSPAPRPEAAVPPLATAPRPKSPPPGAPQGTDTVRLDSDRQYRRGPRHTPPETGESRPWRSAHPWLIEACAPRRPPRVLGMREALTLARSIGAARPTRA